MDDFFRLEYMPNYNIEGAGDAEMRSEGPKNLRI